MANAISIHPAVDKGTKPAAANFAGGTLVCHCSDKKVAVAIDSQCAYNHVCGCTKCWKPAGALFSQVAAVPRDKLRVTATATNSRSWIRMRLSNGTPARVAAYTCTVALRMKSIRSSVSISSTRNSRRTKAGRRRNNMGAVRARLRELKFEPYDCLSPALMDAIATHTAKASGVLGRG